MAYKIRLPADFGRKHILTTDLLQTTLQMDDFSRAAVDSFIEACYTGEVQLNKDLFRDLNKMAHVFKIDWLIERCFEYYNELVQQIKKNDYEEKCFAFEEAVYVSKSLKKQNFSDLIIHTINILDTDKGSFVTKYLHNLSSRSRDQLKLVVELAGSNTQLLADALLATLGTDGAILEDNARYLLKNINFIVLREKHRAVHNQLLNLLQNMGNITMEDLKMIVRLQAMETPTTNEEQVEVAPNKNIPNMNSCSIKLVEFLKLPFDEFLQKMIDSPDVKNLYMLIDGVWLWLYDNKSDKTLTFTEELLGKIVSVMTYRGWKPVTKEYLAKIWKCYTGCNHFINALKECNDLVNEGDVLIHSTELFSIEEFAVPCTKIKFHFSHPSAAECTKEGQCGFMLNVTKDDSGSFDIQLSNDPDEYPDDLHFHENLILTRNMHLAINKAITAAEEDTLITLPWGEQLECDGTGKYWRWGCIQFREVADADKCKWETLPWREQCCISGKFKFTIIYHE